MSSPELHQLITSPYPEKSIRTRIIRYFLLIILIPALISPIFTLIFLYRENVAHQSAHFVTEAIEKSRYIENLLETRATEAMVISQFPEIRRFVNAYRREEGSLPLDSVSYRLETYLLHNNHRFSGIKLLNETGDLLLHVSDSDTSPALEKGQNYADQSWFVGAMHLAAIRGGNVPVYYDHPGPDQPVRFSTILLDDEGILFGVLVLEVNMPEFFNEAQISEGTMCVILDENGTALTGSLADHDCSMHKPEIYDSVIHKRSGVLFTDDPIPKQAFAFSRIQPEAQSSIRWTVMYEHPLSGVLGTFMTALLMLVIATAVSIAIGLLFSVKFANELTRPLRQLSTAAHDIAHGHWDTKIEPYPHQDEFGILNQSFTSMCRQLRTSQESLIQNIQDLEESQTRYIQEKERLSVTLKSIGDAVIALNAEGNVQLVNPAAESLLGMTYAELTGRSLDVAVNFYDIRSGEEITSVIEHTNTPDHKADFLPEFRLVNQTGDEFIIEYSNNTISGPGDQPMGSVLIMRNVSEIRKLQNEKHRVEKLESLGVLAGGIAHDFNNLLAVILGDLSLLEVRADGDPDQKEHLKHAMDATSRARTLTHQLLTFSKGGSPVKKATSVGELLRESTQFALHGSACKSNIEIDENEWVAEVDENQMHQVFHNLTINAVQAMTASGILTVRLSNEKIDKGNEASIRPGNYIRIEFSDNGKGIPAQNMSKIFDPYFTTKTDGSGLGLSSVHSIVTAHGGYVDVTSSPSGTTVILHIPALTGHQLKEEPETTVPEMTVTTSARVLLLDDEPGILFTTSKFLEHLGHQVETSKHGDETLNKAEQALNDGSPFDMVILDLTIPGGKGGLEIIRELKKLDPKMKAIVSSGYSQNQAISTYREAGFDAVLLKPYSLKEFKETLNAVLTS